MTDRKMLELAAKAIGIKITWHGDVDPWCFAEVLPGIKWNPLDDDGDNRRLQVDLKIELIITDQSANACFDGVFYSEPLGHSARKAARRAVLRAAAEIGKGMKND